MATSAKGTASYSVDIVNELIAKLVEQSPEALAAINKHGETLLTISRCPDLDSSGILGAVLDYYHRFNSLPSWTDLHDYVWGLPQNAGLQVDFDSIRELTKDYTPIFTSYDVLIGELDEQVQTLRVLKNLDIARRIAAGGWADPNVPIHKKVLLKGAKAAKEWLASQIELDEDDGYVAEEGEEALIKGRDGVSTFVLTTISADSIQAESVKWLWPDRFPLGKMSLISGKPDNGKSQVTLDIVARTTKGADWPDGSKNILGPREVLMAIAEDDLADTVKPRLMAAGADMTRIKFISRIRTQEFDEKAGKKSEVRRLQLAEDIKKLKMALEQNSQIALVVVDTLTSYFGDVNTNADQDIRPVMDGLAKAFGDCEACFLGIIHHNKKSDVDALQAILGASSVAGAVRSAYSCSRDPENDDEFYFTLVKGNLTKKRTGMKYRMAETTISGITAPYIEWAGETDEDANSVMAKVKESRSNKHQQIDKARLFLPMALEKGQRPAKDLYRDAQAEGISVDQLKRAKYELNVKSVKKADGWYWWIPDAGTEKTLVYDGVM